MKKRLAAFCLMVILLCVALAPAVFATGTSNVANDARNGIVRVVSWYKNLKVQLVDLESHEYVAEEKAVEEYASLGSGFGVGKKGKETDYFVTNRHVVDKELREPLSWQSACYYLGLDEEAAGMLAEELEGYTCVLTGDFDYAIILLDDYAIQDGEVDASRTVPCTVEYRGNDFEPDLAVLHAQRKVPGRVALPLLKEGHEAKEGDTVYALGYPGSTDALNTTYAASVERVTITNGVISLYNQYIDNNGTQVDFVQSTATINAGNSGGPLIEEHGAVIAVNTFGWGQDDSSNETGGNGAIDIKYVRDRLDNLKIEYDVYPGNIFAEYWWIFVIVGAVLILAIGSALFVKTRKSAQTAPASNNASLVSSNPAQTTPAAGQFYGVTQPGPAPVLAPTQPSVPGDSGLRILGTSGTFAGKKYMVAGQVRIGRDPARNDLVYPASTKGVSGIHCVVSASNGRLTLQDLGSTYGTFVAGKRIAANQSVELAVGERFSLGSDQETFTVVRKGEI